MKKRNEILRRAAALVTAAVMLTGSAGDYAALSVQAEETSVTERSVTEEKVFALEELPDSNELLAGYIDQLFYGDTGRTVSELGIVGDKKLTDPNEKKMYRELKASIEDIADGSRTSSVISVSGLSIEVSEWERSVKKVLSYLLMDCPYSLYWFDKNSAVVNAKGSGTTVRITTFSFTVAGEYQGGGRYVTNTSKMAAAKHAVSYAKEIAAKHAAEPDREKLTSYCREICSLVSYNTSAANGGTAYGNPWQIIWVFDRDPSTNVVCEGYSKAFQYLCDLSSFEGNTVCYTATGVMGDGRKSGNHMWNIVTLNGANYLVDVTNCDSGGAGSDGSLFLAVPKSGTMNTSYTFANSAGRSIMYTYSSESKELLGKSVLRLAGTDETDSETSVALILKGQRLKNNAVLKASFNKKYSFKAAVTDEAGRVLADGSSKITWSVSDKRIAAVTSGGKVSVKKKAGTVTVTARTVDGETAKVRLKAGRSAVKVSGVKITGSKSMNLKTKKTQKLKTAVTPATAANQKVTWKSSNKKIATVNSKGKVTAKKAGTVRITAAAKDGSKKKTTFRIRIKKK